MEQDPNIQDPNLRDPNLRDPNSHPDILFSEKIVAGRKVFFLDLKENQRGRFMQITEDVAGRRNRIMVPLEAFADFGISLMRLLNEAEHLPPREDSGY
jgi:hypothetical protein